MARAREITITKLERDDEGFWTCTITAGRTKVKAHSRHGSWMTDVEDGMKDIMPDVAAKIQEKVRPIEKKERIAREKAKA